MYCKVCKKRNHNTKCCRFRGQPRCGVCGRGHHSLAPPPPRTVTLHHFGPCTLVPPSLTPSPLNQRLRTIRGLHVVYCASNILNILHFQHPIDHRCLGRLCKGNWNRPFQESLRCRDRTRKFSRGYPRTAPRTREGIQGLSGRKSEANQLPQPGGECHPGVLGHSRRGGQPGKSHMSSGNSFNVTSSGPLPTGKSIVRWDRCPPLCSSL
jgi:hypothetical protein